MPRLLGSRLLLGFIGSLWLGLGFGTSASAAEPIDCAKPVAPCTACHSPLLTQHYASCAEQAWIAPPEAKTQHSPLAGSPKVITAGKANFGVFCEGCHGPRADGAGPIAVKYGIPVADLTTPQVQQESDGELFWKLTHGYGAMPTWSDALSDEDRWQLVAYIRSFKKSP
jgi:mono/diheme cytochrome c family protein